MSARTIVLQVQECFKPFFIVKRELANPDTVGQWVIRVSEEDSKKLAELAPHREALSFKGFFVDASSRIPPGFNKFIIWKKTIENKDHYIITWVEFVSNEYSLEDDEVDSQTKQEEIKQHHNQDNLNEAIELLEKLLVKLQEMRQN